MAVGYALHTHIHTTPYVIQPRTSSKSTATTSGGRPVVLLPLSSPMAGPHASACCFGSSDDGVGPYERRFDQGLQSALRFLKRWLC